MSPVSAVLYYCVIMSDVWISRKHFIAVAGGGRAYSNITILHAVGGCEMSKSDFFLFIFLIRAYLLCVKFSSVKKLGASCSILIWIMNLAKLEMLKIGLTIQKGLLSHNFLKQQIWSVIVCFHSHIVYSIVPTVPLITDLLNKHSDRQN